MSYVGQESIVEEFSNLRGSGYFIADVFRAGDYSLWFIWIRIVICLLCSLGDYNIALSRSGDVCLLCRLRSYRLVQLTYTDHFGLEAIDEHLLYWSEEIIYGLMWV